MLIRKKPLVVFYHHVLITDRAIPWEFLYFTFIRASRILGQDKIEKLIWSYLFSSFMWLSIRTIQLYNILLGM